MPPIPPIPPPAGMTGASLRGASEIIASVVTRRPATEPPPEGQRDDLGRVDDTCLEHVDILFVWR